MICNIVSAAELVYKRGADALYIYTHLTKENSDFNRKLRSWLLRQRQPVEADGRIAVVIEHGEIIGWARTEYWLSSDGVDHDTLEAFVVPDYRRCGIATFAAAGLYASGLHEAAPVAVFKPAMLLVARRAGLSAVLYEKVAEGQWVAA